MLEPLDQIKINKIMTTSVVVLTPADNMNDACQKMRSKNIRHLPVVDHSGQLIGVFTDRDLNRAYSPRETESGWYYSKSELELLSLKHFMTKDPFFLTPDHSLKDAAKAMAFHKYGCIPIVDSDSKKIVGIISYIDILKFLTA